VLKSEGGPLKPFNIAGACFACNHKRSNTPLTIFLLELKKEKEAALKRQRKHQRNKDMILA
jgi:hypothetical protein